jgi:ketosteroid isomerase-like protein
VTHDDLQRWLDRYLEAWRTNDPAQVGALFTNDAVYRYRPYGGDQHAAIGREAIIQAWLEEGDPPGSWDARYEPWAVEGNRAVAVGRSEYFATEKAEARTFHNAFLLTFAADGRCAEFTDYYMREETS